MEKGIQHLELASFGEKVFGYSLGKKHESINLCLALQFLRENVNVRLLKKTLLNNHISTETPLDVFTLEVGYYLMVRVKKGNSGTVG